MNKPVVLTKEQQECVDYKAGDLLVKGVPGSGKSVVLLKRALKIYQDTNGTASIKIFTYTNILVKYTDELLQAKIGEGIEVSTVDGYFMKVYHAMSKHKLCCNDKKCIDVIENTLTDHAETEKDTHRFYALRSDFWKEEFMWIQERCITDEKDYIEANRRGRGAQVRIVSELDKKRAWSIYQIFREKMSNAHCNTWPEMYLYINEHLQNIPEKYKVDYVFIDEAQDMTIGKMRALKAISRKSITIAADMAQKIYKTSFTWREVGIDIQGRASKSLHRTFRSTKQIVTLAEDLASVTRNNDSFKGELTEAVFPVSEGPVPVLLVFHSKLNEESYLVDLVKKLLQQYPSKTIGIICKTKKYYYHIRASLRNKGVPYQEVFRDKTYAPEWQLLEPGLKLVVAKSSKGLEFDIVLIPDIDEETYPFIPNSFDNEQLEDFLATERNLLYVAMTRAREILIMLCTEKNKSRFVKEFSQNHYRERTYDLG